YSLYLWHWPVLRFWEWRFGVPSVGVGVLLVAASVVPAWLSYRWVESPIRHARSLNLHPRYALSVGFNFTLFSLVAGLLLTGAAALQGTGTAGRATGATWDTTVTAPPDQAGATAPPDQSGTTAPPDQSGATTGPDGQPAGLPLPSAEQPGDPPFFDVLTPDPLQATN